MNGFTEEHRAALKSCKHVWIAYDRDEAGDQAAEQLKTEFSSCARVLFPKGMDANEYALKVTPAPPSLAVLLNKTGREPEVRRQESEVRTDGDEIVIEQDGRRYRVRGLAKNLSHELLRINLLAGNAKGFHVDTLDLYSARPRAAYIKQAAEEMGMEEDLVRKDLGQGAALKLEEMQGEQICKKAAQSPAKSEVLLTEEQRAEAMSLRWKTLKLLERIVADFARCGIVGEDSNKLLGYLAAVSRHLESPLGGRRAIEFGCRQILPDGCDSRVCSGRRAHSVLGDDGAVALLHGRDGSQTQGAGHRGGGRRQPRRVRAEAAAERGRVVHRIGRAKDPATGKTGHASVSCPGGLVMIFT